MLRLVLFALWVALPTAAIVVLVMRAMNTLQRLRDEIARLEKLVDAHHAMDAVHSHCGTEALTTAWNRECEVCRKV
jgi:hypothetical protein